MQSTRTARAALLFVVCLSPGLASSQTVDLAARVENRIAGFDGSVGVYAKNLKSGARFERDADEIFATASVFKIPVMIELFRRAERGDLRLDERLKLPTTGISRSVATGALRYLHDAPELSLLDYCRLMIVLSDDVATDLLMTVVDPAAITRTMARLGFPHTRVAANLTVMHYRMAGIDATVATAENDALLRSRVLAGELQPVGLADRTLIGNVTTPREMGTILERLHRGEIVSQKSSTEMLEILTHAAGRGMIPRHLPRETVVAHKTGGTWRVKADVGIVSPKTAPIVVSIFTYYDPKEKDAANVIADVAHLVVRALGGR